MSEELAREIEAGRGADEAVALALGWRRDNDPRYMVQAWIYPNGDKFLEPPAFLTDLNALAAECERRGWRYGQGNQDFDRRQPWAWVRSMYSFNGNADTPARALAAALVRAAGETR